MILLFTASRRYLFFDGMLLLCVPVALQLNSHAIRDMIPPR